MNQISHKQAIHWIDLRLDGLLTERQLFLLDEHLRSCDSCSAYATEIEQIPGHLQTQLHARWNEKPGPSPKVMQHVTTKAKGIPVANRVSSGIRLFGSAAALLVLGVVINFVISRLPTITPAIGTQAANNMVQQVETGLLAFTSDLNRDIDTGNGNFDIYTIHPDGSGLTNLTNHSADDVNPIWSPDGKRIAFESDRDGSMHIYSMNANGSDVIRLTDGEGNYQIGTLFTNFTPWSPDGTKLIFSKLDPNQAPGLYVMDREGKNKTLLSSESNANFASWSPDGKRIAYLAGGPEIVFMDLYIVNADGSNPINLKQFLPENESFYNYMGYYYWSQDGQSIFFSSYQPAEQETGAVYEFSLLDNLLTERNRSSAIILDWWQDTSFLAPSNVDRLASFTFLRWGGTSTTFKPFEACESGYETGYGWKFRRSPHGNLVIAAYCPSESGWLWWLYWANADGTTTQQLLDAPMTADDFDLSDIVWSPDDRFITFSGGSGDLSDLYILDVQAALQDPATRPLKFTTIGTYYNRDWQVVVDSKVVEERPTSEPTQTAFYEDLIAFVSTQSGNSDIYTMPTNGSAVINLTNDPAEDFYPVWSPDGRRIAFVSSRDGNNNIYVMSADGSGLTRLTDDPTSDVVPVWSPDSTKIAYAAQDSGEDISNIYIVDLTGQTRRALTDNVPGPAMVWPETWSLDGQYLFFHMDQQIIKVNVENGDNTSITPPDDVPLHFTLSKDGSKLLYLAWCGENSAVFCNQVKTVYEDGASEETLATVELQEVCRSKETSPTEMTDHYEMVKWSPDRTKILFAFYCEENGGLFYMANADGSDFKPLTNDPILYEASSFDWSPDSRSVIFSSALDNAESDSTYILNINHALENPDLNPEPLNTSASQISFFAWRPLANPNIVAEEPMPASEPVTTPQPSPHVVPTQPVEEVEEEFVFVIDQGGSYDIYTMHSDHGEVANLTNNPADDGSPAWSPDGKRIAFESDRTGFVQIFLMNADGSNVVQVTEDETDHRFENRNPWSPDGTRLIVTAKTPPDSSEKAPGNGEWTLYAVSVDEQNKTPLASVPDIYSNPSWSPNGEHVAFIMKEPQGDHNLARIQVVDANGGNLTNVTKLLPVDEELISWKYSWSPDGQTISFVAGRSAWETGSGSSRYAAYEVTLDGETLTEKATSSNPLGDWWEGTSFILGFDESPFTWLRSDGTYSTLDPFERCSTNEDPEYSYVYERSQHGNLVIALSCSDNSLWLYWANPDGTIIKPLLDFPVSTKASSVPNITWSPDDRFILFNVESADNLTDLYTLDIEAALNVPFAQPYRVTQITSRENSLYNSSWRPLP